MGVYLKAREVIEVIQTIESALDTFNKLPIYGFPEQKRGHWVPVNQDERGYAKTYQCTCCGGYTHLSTWERECEYEYCPHCGNNKENENEAD